MVSIHFKHCKSAKCAYRNPLAAKILRKRFDSSLIIVGENVEPLEIEEAAMRSNLIQQIVVVGQVHV